MTHSDRRTMHRHRFLDQSIDLPDSLTEAPLDGRAGIRCGDEHAPKRPGEAWSGLSSPTVECVDSHACVQRADNQDQP